MRLAVAGATGLVGRALVERALAAGDEIIAVGRRPVADAGVNVSTDFSGALTLPLADAGVCALGTTRAVAGSREAFRSVDYGAVLSFAEALLAGGTEHLVVVTAVGASPASPVFYSRVKGEVERDLGRLPFRRLDILRPGLLLGERDGHRPGEALFQRMDPILRRLLPGALDRYAGIAAGTVADAALALCHREAGRRERSGIHRHDNRAMIALAGAGT